MLEWFDTTFNILTVNIVLMFISCILLLVCTCFAFAARYKPQAPVKKDRAALVLLYISLLLLIVSSMCSWYISSHSLFWWRRWWYLFLSHTTCTDVTLYYNCARQSLLRTAILECKVGIDYVSVCPFGRLSTRVQKQFLKANLACFFGVFVVFFIWTSSAGCCSHQINMYLMALILVIFLKNNAIFIKCYSYNLTHKILSWIQMLLTIT